MPIVAAVDGETSPDRTLVVGDELAEQLGEELVALHVMSQQRFENIRESMGGDEGGGLADVLFRYEGFEEYVRGHRDDANPYTVDLGHRDAAGVARSVVEDTLGEGADVDVQGQVGSPVDQIIGAADRRDARYLVVGGRRRTAVGKAVFGSVTQSVLLNAERPVVTVPKDGVVGTVGGTAPVVAGVDRSERAARVVRAGWDLAEGLDRPLHVVHVARETDAAELEGVDDGAGADDLRAAAERVADDAAGGVADAFESVGLVGSPSRQLLEYADDRDAAYLVTAGRRRSPVGKVLFGSVTQSVLLSAERPVLTVMTER